MGSGFGNVNLRPGFYAEGGPEAQRPARVRAGRRPTVLERKPRYMRV